MSYLYLKALHIIFVVTWFAGLFYIVRLFIYHTEAQQMPHQERLALSNQFKIMQKRLWYGITWPSAFLVLIFGGALLKDWMPIKDHPWLITKLCFVVGLYLYHIYCGRIFKRLQKDQFTMSAQKLRIWNEVATIFLVAIVFLVTLKSVLDMVWGLVGLAAFTITLLIAIKLYRKKRLSRS